MGDTAAAAETVPEVRSHYVRPPEREDLYVQRLVYEDEHVVVTLLDAARLQQPLQIGGVVAAEPGSSIVWFTFPGEAHDVGRFHRLDGTFTGLYADILEPVQRLGPREWRAVDLFLDVWLPAGGGGPVLLDEEELEAALANGWISRETAAAARAEADRLLALASAGEWPPPVVQYWTLERARAAAETGTPSH
ncbi:MAG TPA: DUF402 domain-containing protein [Longimicrobiales bacterium]